MRHTPQQKENQPTHPRYTRTHDRITNRNRPPQEMALARPPPRKGSRTNQLPRLRHHPRMGHHTPTNQPRTRPHHPIRTRRHRHHRQRTRHLPQMQPITRRQTHQLEQRDHHHNTLPHHRRHQLVNLWYTRSNHRGRGTIPPHLYKEYPRGLAGYPPGCVFSLGLSLCQSRQGFNLSLLS